MTRFVQLTTPNGKPIFVNLDHILAVRDRAGGGSDLLSAHDAETIFVVKEPPAQVVGH